MSSSIRPTLRALLLLLLIFPSAAQQPSTQHPTFRAETNLVVLPVLVKDQHGQAIYGLHANDFVVDDDGIVQTLRLDEAAQSEPISLVVAIQRGRSAPFEYPRMTGLDTMIDPILNDPQTQVAIVAFDDQIDLVTDFTSDHALIASDFKKMISKRLGSWYPKPREGGLPSSTPSTTP